MIVRPFLSSASFIKLHVDLASRSPPWASSITRSFTTSAQFLEAPKPTHYDVLGVQPSVSPAELKKRFYVLSKENHPDLHPNSKEHTSKFQQISESYTVLADPDKRRKYDRDVMQTRPTVRSGSGFAGSRPATGLSKRRSTFRGPPPSFSGGRPNQSQSQQSFNDASTGGTSSSAYAWGPEPQFQQTTDFNPQPVFRTQTVEDQRRNQRRAAAAAAAQAEFDEEGDFWAKFVIVTVIVVVGTTVGGLVAGAFDNTPRGGGMVRGDGTLRRPEGGTKKDHG